MEGNKGSFRGSFRSEVMQLSGYDSTDQGTLWPGDLGENGSAKTRASLKLFFFGEEGILYI